MEYKISYQKTWNNATGTCYRQTISMKLTREELDSFNAFIEGYCSNKNSNPYVAMFLQNIKEGTNYLNFTTQWNLIWHFNMQGDKRWLQERNTIAKIKIVH